MVKAFLSQDRENYMWQHVNKIACSGYFPTETCFLLHKYERMQNGLGNDAFYSECFYLYHEFFKKINNWNMLLWKRLSVQ